MFDLNSIKRTTGINAPRILLTGTAGVGKTTFAAGAPSPIFLFTEDGSGVLEVDAFPQAQSFDDAMSAIKTLYTQEHEFKTFVVDSVDHLEPLIWQEICRREGVQNIEAIGYGKGYTMALDLWRQFLTGLDALRSERNMAIVLIAHIHIKRFESPEHDAIDRYEPKLHNKASSLLQESVDCILFARHQVATKTEDLGFDKKRTRGVSTNQRVICTTETPAYIAKNRYALPPELPLSWEAFAKALSASLSTQSQQTTEGEAA